MPELTPLEVVRRMTLSAAMIRDAVEEALVTTDDYRQERIADALRLSQHLIVWMDYAYLRGWDLVAKHGMAQVRLGNAWLDRIGGL